MIAAQGTAEARDWLDAAKYPNHSVMEMSTENARMMVAGFYDRGAERVYVLESYALGEQCRHGAKIRRQTAAGDATAADRSAWNGGEVPAARSPLSGPGTEVLTHLDGHELREQNAETLLRFLHRIGTERPSAITLTRLPSRIDRGDAAAEIWLLVIEWQLFDQCTV